MEVLQLAFSPAPPPTYSPASIPLLPLILSLHSPLHCLSLPSLPPRSLASLPLPLSLLSPFSLPLPSSFSLPPLAASFLSPLLTPPPIPYQLDEVAAWLSRLRHRVKLDGAIDVINQLSGARDVNLAIPSPILFPTMALSQAHELSPLLIDTFNVACLSISMLPVELPLHHFTTTPTQPSNYPLPVELIKLSIELI